MKVRKRYVQFVTNYNPEEARQPAGSPGGGQWTSGGGGPASGAATAAPPSTAPAVGKGADGTTRGVTFGYPKGYIPPKSLSPGVAPGPNPDAPSQTRPMLSPQEANSLTTYSDVSVFRDMNRDLRNMTPLARAGKLAQMFGSKNPAGIHEDMQKVFARTKTLDTPIAVKRGIFADNPDQLGQHFLQNAGKVVQMPGYQSTSIVPTSGGDPYTAQGGGYKGNVKFTIHAVHGIDMQPYSKFPGEHEFLLNHASEYKVGRVEKRGGEWHIELFQLPPKKGQVTNEYTERYTDGTEYRVRITYTGNARSADRTHRIGSDGGGQRGCCGHSEMEPVPTGTDTGGGSQFTINPFVSEAQRAWMHANKPKMAKEWEAHTPKGKHLPRRKKLTNNTFLGRYDPTRTVTLRRSFAIRLRKKFAIIRGRVRTLIVQQNAFGLTENYNPDQLRDVDGRWLGEGGIPHTAGGDALHGTSTRNWVDIKKHGIIPNAAPGADEWANRQGAHFAKVGDRAAAVYVTTDLRMAGLFARASAELRGGKPTILRVHIPYGQSGLSYDEKSKITDDFGIRQQAPAWKYQGTIKPEWIVGRYISDPNEKSGWRFTKNAAGHTFYIVVHFHDEMTNPPTANVFNPDQPRDEKGQWADSGGLPPERLGDLWSDYAGGDAIKTVSRGESLGSVDASGSPITPSDAEQYRQAAEQLQRMATAGTIGRNTVFRGIALPKGTDVRAAFRVNDYHTLDSLTAAATDRKVAEKYTDPQFIGADEGEKVLLRISRTGGVVGYINPAGELEKGVEAILPRGSRFRVYGYHKEGDTHVIDLHDPGKLNHGLVRNFNPDEPRDERGRWSESGSLRDLVEEKGGFTYRPIGRGSSGERIAHQPVKGFVVSIPREAGYEQPISEKEFKNKGKYLIQQYLKRVRDDIRAGKLNKDRTHVGAWHDKATGRVVLDVNELYQNKEEAINVGRKRKQDAVFDLGTFAEIDLRDEHGKRPTGNSSWADWRRNRRGTGSTGRGDVSGIEPVDNTHFAFTADPHKLEMFQRWLHQQFDSELTSTSDEKVWQAYIESGFRRGAGRAWDDSDKDIIPEDPALPGFGAGYAKGGKDGFINLTLRAPETAEKVKLLAGRAFDELENVTSDMSVRMSRILADGLIEGANPRDIGKRMNEAIDLGEARAERIARTELIRAHAEGQLDAFDALGVSELGVDVEWSTAGDGRVCPACEEMDGTIYTIEDAHGLIPLHPDCRCAFIPAIKALED